MKTSEEHMIIMDRVTFLVILCIFLYCANFFTFYVVLYVFCCLIVGSGAGNPFSGGGSFGGMNPEDILKSFFGGNTGPFGATGANFSSGGFQETAQV